MIPLRRRAWRAPHVVAALGFAALLVLMLFGLHIPVDFMRERIELAAREASGLELRIEGRLFLVVGVRPGFSASGVVVKAANLELLRFGTGQVEVEPTALLAREVRIRRVLAADVVLRLDDAVLDAVAAAAPERGARSGHRGAGA